MNAVVEEGGDRVANDRRREALMDMYRAFNARDIDAAVSRMAPDVDWPNAMTGGRERGPSAVRRYWENQWREIDPRVEPLKIDFDAAGDAHVRVHQLVRGLDGAIMEDKKIEHVYSFEGPFIGKMTIVDRDPEPDDDEEDEMNDGKAGRAGKGAARAVPTLCVGRKGVGTPLRGFAHPTG